MTDPTSPVRAEAVVSTDEEGRFIIDEQAVVHVTDMKISSNINSAVGSFFATVDDETHPHNGKRVVVAGMCPPGSGQGDYVVPRSCVIGVASDE